MILWFFFKNTHNTHTQMQATVAMNNKQAKKAAAVEATQGSKTEEFKLQDF